MCQNFIPIGRLSSILCFETNFPSRVHPRPTIKINVEIAALADDIALFAKDNDSLGHRRTEKLQYRLNYLEIGSTVEN